MYPVYKWCGAAIHDRNFRSVNLDKQIVNMACNQRCHQMFDGGNPYAVSADYRCHPCIYYILGTGFDPCGAVAFSTLKNYPAPGFGREQYHVDSVAGM
jgi:hypothetical protein